MNKEVKIIPPEGYEFDKEKSTFEVIKFKPIEKKAWRYDGSKEFKGYYITNFAKIERSTDALNIPQNYNIFATEKQAKSALAMARISQIMANDERFGGVVTDEEWKIGTPKFVIVRRSRVIDTDINHIYYKFLAFHTKQQRTLFLEENEDLVKDYLMID